MMNLNLTTTINFDHIVDRELRRDVIGLCRKTGKPVLKLSTKDRGGVRLGRTGEHSSIQHPAAYYHRMAGRQAQCGRLDTTGTGTALP